MPSLGWTHINIDYIWLASTLYKNIPQHTDRHFQEFVYGAKISIMWTITPVYMIPFNFSMSNYIAISPMFEPLFFTYIFCLQEVKTYRNYYLYQVWYSTEAEISQNWRIRYTVAKAHGNRKGTRDRMLFLSLRNHRVSLICASLFHGFFTLFYTYVPFFPSFNLLFQVIAQYGYLCWISMTFHLKCLWQTNCKVLVQILWKSYWFNPF